MIIKVAKDLNEDVQEKDVVVFPGGCSEEIFFTDMAIEFADAYPFLADKLRRSVKKCKYHWNFIKGDYHHDDWITLGVYKVRNSHGEFNPKIILKTAHELAGKKFKKNRILVEFFAPQKYTMQTLLNWFEAPNIWLYVPLELYDASAEVFDDFARRTGTVIEKYY